MVVLLDVPFATVGGIFALYFTCTVLSVSAAVGIIALVAGVGGFLLRPTSLVERVLLVAGGLLLLAPGFAADVAGLALFAMAGASQLLRRARRPATAAA